MFQQLIVALVFPDWTTVTASCLEPHPASPIYSECCGSTNFQNSTVRTHYPNAHQVSLAAHPRTYLLQTGRYDVSIHPWHLSVLPTVIFHCFTSVAYMTSRRRLRSSTSHRLDAPPIRLSTVGRRVSGATVWNYRPLNVASAPSLAVFRQRLKTFLFSRSYQDTIIWVVCYYYHSSLLSGQLVLAIINIIRPHSKCLWWWGNAHK